MKILQIHKYYSRKRGGGSVSAFFETKELLEKKGHDVLVFSMKDQFNEPSEYDKYFAEHFDLRVAGFFEKIFLIPRVIYNRDAVKKLDRFLSDHKPDVAHVHNIYHYLTPGIFGVLKKHNIPIVFKLSDYHAVCPNYKLFAHGAIDNACESKKYYKIFFNKSIGNSWAESFVGMIEGYINNWFKYYENVTLFAAPSEFMRDLCSQYGISRDKIKILRNVLNFDSYDGVEKKEKTFLYMGRISDEKGLDIAIDAMNILKKGQALDGWKLIIAGHGPDEERLKKIVQKDGSGDVVEFFGFCKKGEEEWFQLMRSASVAVLPSVWYDNSPIAISESMAFSTPVIVSDYGGTHEMIENGKSGYVFEAKNSEDLAGKMQNFINDANLVNRMGSLARDRVHVINNEEGYYNTLIEIYNEAITRVKNKND